MSLEVEFSKHQCIEIFITCHDAISRGDLIHRKHRKDKEFPFQNWFQTRLEEA
ncbi:hypothetical protein [Oscillatoria acuminata]|uniref:hypothetical protein n=1 Tax=Oscillatoria acuminata TaxID=118323 RepID=UPI00031DADAE|nr:hypothetical protein [Oscillatoria acuminata]